MKDNKNILVLCTGNSCRSQLAEGFLRHYCKNGNIYSAGIETHGVNPLAIEVMKEKSIDISSHTSNHIDEYQHIAFDFVITVCDHAKERCPYFPTTALTLHHNFPDPAKAIGTQQEIMNEFRAVRDMIDDYCKQFIEKHLSSSL